MSKEIPELSGSKSDKFASNWHSHGLNRHLETPKRLEEAAKFLSGMISISLTIFLIGGKDFLKNNETFILIIGSAWLLSLIFSFLVLFPRKYKFYKNSAEDIARSHDKIVKYKYCLLVISVILFFIAVLLLFLLFIEVV